MSCDVPLVDIVIIQAVRSLVTNLASFSLRLIGIHNSTGDVYCLQLNRKKLSNFPLVPHISNNEIHVAKSSHLYFVSNLWIRPVHPQASNG